MESIEILAQRAAAGAGRGVLAEVISGKEGAVRDDAAGHLGGQYHHHDHQHRHQDDHHHHQQQQVAVEAICGALARSTAVPGTGCKRDRRYIPGGRG